MLVSIAIDPACFGPQVVVDDQSRFNAERVLDSILGNAVLVSAFEQDYLDRLIDEVSALGTSCGEHIQILMTDLLKQRRKHMVALSSTMPDSSLDALRESATKLKADLVVCKNIEDVEELEDLNKQGIEVCDLRNFVNSSVEETRRNWSQAQRLDLIDTEDASGIVGSAVKYSHKIVIYDYTIALAAKRASEYADSNDADRYYSYLKNYARGITYIVRQWCGYSPYAESTKPEVSVITSGEDVASKKYFDPSLAKRWIEQAIRDVDIGNQIGDLQIFLKIDSHPHIFLERFIDTEQRCWGMQHGADYFGKLWDEPQRRQPTFITPHSDDYRQLVGQILKLREAV